MHKMLLTGLALAAATCLPLTTAADEGHDHDAAPAAATTRTLPRFATVSELFELVGVVDGQRITIYLDRFEDNAPVKGARLDLQVGSAKVELKELADGEFEGTLPQALQPGVAPVTATVVAGNDTDLLAADLDVHADEHGEAGSNPGWPQTLGWTAGVLAALAALAWAARRALAGRRMGGTA
ncbi:MAG: hypothetical protein ACOZJX_08365 [Pseudomonadota bacterium]